MTNRVLIIGDMEGVSGIVHWDQVAHQASMYQEGRRLYTEELNAAVRGAKAAGAEEILVIDTHGAGAAATNGGHAFNSLIPELMDPACEFITHHGWGNFIDVLEEGMDACLYIGAHAMGGTPGAVLSHTIASGHWLEIAINDQVVGEIGVVAALCGHFDIPMVLVSGDDKMCEEATALLGTNLTAVCVKKGLSRFSARNIAPQRARKMIEQAARKTLSHPEKFPTPYKMDGPVTIRLEIVTADNMDKYRSLEGIEILDPRTILSKGTDFISSWKKVAPFK
jgi:D-amino peptidase